MECITPNFEKCERYKSDQIETSDLVVRFLIAQAVRVTAMREADIPIAQTVNVTPLSADDWEIMEMQPVRPAPPPPPRPPPPDPAGLF